ncbi:hypothetical protein HED63_07530 [Ochrobactrum cytisi]|nr:hypothetical protein [Brucella cytisi]
MHLPTRKLWPARIAVSRAFAPLPRHELGFPSIVVASRNDEYMSFAKVEALSHVWGSGFVDLGGPAIST